MLISGKCAVIVAHPDDETLWMGGTMLLHTSCQWTIVAVCRKSDPDRAPRFLEALKAFNARGAMGDLDDGPEQDPLPTRKIQDCIMDLLTSDRFDTIFTHSMWGEYTRHIRHEQTGKAVMALRRDGKLHCKQLFTFAYEDGGGKYLPRPISDSGIISKLPVDIWQRKYDIITKIYGFSSDSFEARTTPKAEAFWHFGDAKRKPGESARFQENLT